MPNLGNEADMRPCPENAPLVSVILTSYNHEPYIAEAIRSVFAQSYRPMELVVVDDGSKDGSRGVIEEVLRDAPIPATPVFKENGGQASAYNAAWPHARGSLVCFIDSDDVWLPDKVERMVSFWREHPGGALYQHQVLVGGGVSRHELVSGDMLAYWSQYGGVLNIATHGSLMKRFVPSVGLMFPKAILERLFPMPETLVVCPDGYLTRTACALGPLYSLDTPLARWRDHERNSGKASCFSFYRYWLPVVMPAVNAFYEAHDVPLRFVYDTSSWHAKLCDWATRWRQWKRQWLRK